jgi:hypothetical protein
MLNAHLLLTAHYMSMVEALHELTQTNLNVGIVGQYR